MCIYIILHIERLNDPGLILRKSPFICFYCSHKHDTDRFCYYHNSLALVAATGTHYHISVFLQNDVGAVIKVQNGDGIQFGWSTTRLGNMVRKHQVYLAKKGNTEENVAFGEMG